MDVVSYYLSKTPMAMESECCSQGVVHSRPRVQVGSGEQAQQEGTDRTLTGPVQGCSLGTAVALRGATMALPGRSAAVGGGRQHGGVAEEGPAEQSRRDAAGPRQPSPQQHQRRQAGKWDRSALQLFEQEINKLLEISVPHTHTKKSF